MPAVSLFTRSHSNLSNPEQIHTQPHNCDFLTGGSQIFALSQASPAGEQQARRDFTTTGLAALCASSGQAPPPSLQGLSLVRSTLPTEELLLSAAYRCPCPPKSSVEALSQHRSCSHSGLATLNRTSRVFPEP